ncbi:MAG: hypothetical protein ABIA04_10030 [Pseudomonadota bacterium]
MQDGFASRLQINSQQAFANDINGFKIIGYVPDQDTYSSAAVDCWDGGRGHSESGHCSVQIINDLDADGTVARYDQEFKRDVNNTANCYKDGAVITINED